MNLHYLYKGRSLSHFEYIITIAFRFFVGLLFTIFFIKKVNIPLYINIIYALFDIILIIEYIKNRKKLSTKSLATRMVTYYFPIEYIYSFIMLMYFMKSAVFPVQAIWAVIFLYFNNIKLKSKYFSVFVSFVVFVALLYNFTLDLSFLLNFIYSIVAIGIIVADEMQRSSFSQMEETINKKISEIEQSVIQDNYLEAEAIAPIMDAIEFKNSNRTNHNLRLSKYAYLLSSIYGLHEKESVLFSRAVMYHDVGKRFIEDRLLYKKEKLSDDEFEEIKKHALLGYNYLKNRKNRLMDLASIIALEHHENYNGSGYPYVKFGEQINVFARFTRILDTFDSMLQKKPYRDAKELSKVIEYLESNKSILFDPLIVDFFLENIDKFIKIRMEYLHE